MTGRLLLHETSTDSQSPYLTHLAFEETLRGSSHRKDLVEAAYYFQSLHRKDLAIPNTLARGFSAKSPSELCAGGRDFAFGKGVIEVQR